MAAILQISTHSLAEHKYYDGTLLRKCVFLMKSRLFRQQFLMQEKATVSAPGQNGHIDNVRRDHDVQGDM